MCVLALPDLSADSHKRITLTYKASDFEYSTNSLGEMEIYSNTLDVCFGSDTTQPGLPEVILSVLIPSDMEYVSDNVRYASTVISRNCKMAHNTPDATTNELDSMLYVETPSVYTEAIYPANNVEYVGTEIMDGHKILNFIVTPFRYVNSAGILSILTRIDIDVTLKNSSYIPVRQNVMNESVREIVHNGEDYEAIMGDISMERDSVVSEIDLPMKVLGTGLPIYDYVIITNESLKETFFDLTKWKHIKGLRTRIITMEEIKSDPRYTASAPEDKLKQCLHYYYMNHGIKYVLLGGDASVVPVKYCFGKIENKKGTEVYDIPTDLYFACFDGNFWWNSNGNNVVGERKDGMDLYPEIYVTRALVNSKSTAKIFINRTINYEKYLDAPVWNNNILMSGCHIFKTRKHNGRKQSDAEYKGNLLYKNVISKYWNGGQFRLYDTYSDDKDGSNFDFSQINLQTHLSKSYPFVNILTHGNVDRYSLEHDDLYLRWDAGRLYNPGYTVIVTNACLTNAFDMKDGVYPCVSASFMTNQNSGIIAYLGSSRSGIGNTNLKKLGPSENYMEGFYRRLFNAPFASFGYIVASSKSRRVPQCDNNASERYIQYSLNPIGDPEMNIYTTEPQRLENIKIERQLASVTIDTGEPGCVMYITQEDNDNIKRISYPRDDKSTFRIINGNKKYNIYIEKAGFVPYIYVDDRTLHVIQDELIEGDVTIDAGRILAGDNVSDSKPNGAVVFDGGNIELKATSITLKGGIEVKGGTNFSINPK